jgi:hypothetical protein
MDRRIFGYPGWRRSKLRQDDHSAGQVGAAKPVPALFPLVNVFYSLSQENVTLAPIPE